MAAVMRSAAVRMAGARIVPSARVSLQARPVVAPLRLARRGARSNSSVVTLAKYSADARGPTETLEHRIFIQEKGQDVSAWHDVPLEAGPGAYNFICEIPKESAAKMEVATDEEKTPIKQDVKKGALRFYPYNINWNYGMLPQTWEDPGHKNEEAGGVFGDNDPVDVVEIGSSRLQMGGIYQVKPLGVFAMIDDGELDWKIIAINVEDPLADKLNDVEDVEREMPGELQKIKEWFRDYKIPDGKPANKYGYNDECLNKEFTLGVIRETHDFWKALKSGSRVNDKELALA